MSSWTPPPIIFKDDSEKTETLRRHLTTLGWLNAASDKNPAWQLHLVDGHLTMLRPDGVSLSLDFTLGKARHRQKEAGHGAQTLSKALGISSFQKRNGHLPSIADATGGLGQDGWAIASLGCPVFAIERNPIVHALLDDALKRARLNEISSEIASRITLVREDAVSWLRNIRNADQAHIIYLDPMYPARKHKADSKKGMQFLQALLGPPVKEESESLLGAALDYQARRVVVKRPKGAEEMDGSTRWPGQRTCVQSSNTRYDIYHQSLKF
ncbi:MAG: class I SAM-dependent methyltransferase [Granulosicoccus sp.]